MELLQLPVSILRQILNNGRLLHAPKRYESSLLEQVSSPHRPAPAASRCAASAAAGPGWGPPLRESIYIF